MSTWEQYQMAYQVANSQTRALLNSSIIPDSVETVLNNNTIPLTNKRFIVQVFTYYSLNLIDKNRAIQQLTEYGIQNSGQVFTAIEATVKNTPITTERESNLAINNTIDTLDNDIAETEAALSASAVPPVRTMAGDMAAHHREPVASTGTPPSITQSAPHPTATNDTPAAIHYPTPTQQAPATPSNTPSVPTTPTNLPVSTPDEPVYTTTQAAILREQPAATQSTPQPYNPPATEPTSSPTDPEHHQTTHQQDPDTIRWGHTT